MTDTGSIAYRANPGGMPNPTAPAEPARRGDLGIEGEPQEPWQTTSI